MCHWGDGQGMDADPATTLAHQVDVVRIAAKSTYVPSNPLQSQDHVLVPKVAGDNVVIGAQEACKRTNHQ